MKRITIIGLILLIFLAPCPGFGQDTKTTVNVDKTPRGISWQAWEQMNKRWQSYSTRVYIQKKDGSAVEGQLTWMNDSVLLVQTNFDLPNGAMNPEDQIRIAVRDIENMKVRLGGHPYQGLITGMVAGILPGAITGLILAQGWTIIPAIVFGAVTAGGGGAIGSAIQKSNRKKSFEISAEELTGRNALKMKRSALFPSNLEIPPSLDGFPTLPDFENLVRLSPTLRKAFPDNRYSLSVHSSIMTNSVRKRMQNWYMSPIWGPSDPYYETRIGLEADLSKRIGKKYQAGMLFQFFPGDISSSYFNNNLPEWNVSYSYNHHFNQTTFGIYGGWILAPSSFYKATKMEASIQVGAVVSDVYEHFYFRWDALDNYEKGGETFIRQHNFQPGAMMRLQSSWYLIPGFSIDCGLEGFWIKKILFNQRAVLPETVYGPQYITMHKLNFSSIQGFLGFSVHF